MITMFLALTTNAKPIAPLPLTAQLPTAAHSRALPTSLMMWPQQPGIVDRYDPDSLCHWMAAPSESKLGRSLFRNDEIGYAVVDVAPDAIRVDGEVIVALQDGLIPDEAKRSMAVMPLYETLVSRAESLKYLGNVCGSGHFPGYLGLAISPTIPAITIREVMYTAGQAQFGSVYFLVEGPTQGPAIHMSDDVEIDARRVSVTVDQGTTLSVAGVEYADAAAAAAEHKLGCALVLTPNRTSHSQLTKQLDALLGAGVRDLVITGAGGDRTPAAPTPPGTSTVHFDQTLSAIPVRLPPIGPPPDPTAKKECNWWMMSTLPVPASSLVGAEGTIVSERLGGIGASVPLASTELGDLEHSKGLTADTLRAVLSRHTNQLRYCYTRELNRNADLGAGAMTVSFTVAANGSVSEVTIREDTFSTPDVGTCVAGRVKRFRFPETTGLVEVTADQSLRFAPAQ